MVMESNGDRRDWNLRGPMCEGWPIFHAVHDPVSGSIYAAAASEWHGAGVWRSSDHGETCLGLRPSKTREATSKLFWGYTIGGCNSRVKVKERCTPDANFTLDDTTFKRAPESTVPLGGDLVGPLCLGASYYDFAVCLVAPEGGLTPPSPDSRR